MRTNVELTKRKHNFNDSIVEFSLKDISIFSNQDFGDDCYEYMFKYWEDTYIYNKKTNNYKLLWFDVRQSFSDLKKRSWGLKKEEHKILKLLFGSCTMEISTVPWYITMLKDTINIFYLFQIYWFTVWMMDEVYKYAILIAVITMYSIFGEIVDIRENLNRLQKMAIYECPVKIRRIDENGIAYFIEVMSGDLVPGDVFVVPENWIFPCDVVLISGEAVINEAMLTGESTASHKIEIPNDAITLSEFDMLNLEQVIRKLEFLILSINSNTFFM